MSTPTTPPPAKPAVTNTEEYFNSSRLKVIGMITAATLAVGALGGIAGVVFDPDPVRNQPQLQPESPSGTGGGQAKLLLPAALAADDGQYVALANGVEIFVPTGWRVYFQNDANIGLTDDHGSYGFAYSSAGFDPSTPAAQVVLDRMDDIFPPDHYTQLTVSDFMPWGEPFGTVVSVGYLEYQAIWVDDQGAQPIYGQIYAGVRQDGTALFYEIEHLPPEDFNAAYENLELVGLTFARFGGVS
jgi:hypothetical protein